MSQLKWSQILDSDYVFSSLKLHLLHLIPSGADSIWSFRYQLKWYVRSFWEVEFTFTFGESVFTMSGNDDETADFCSSQTESHIERMVKAKTSLLQHRNLLIQVSSQCRLLGGRHYVHSLDFLHRFKLFPINIHKKLQHDISFKNTISVCNKDRIFYLWCTVV